MRFASQVKVWREQPDGRQADTAFAEWQRNAGSLLLRGVNSVQRKPQSDHRLQTRCATRHDPLCPNAALWQQQTRHHQRTPAGRQQGVGVAAAPHQVRRPDVLPRAGADDHLLHLPRQYHEISHLCVRTSGRRSHPCFLASERWRERIVSVPQRRSNMLTVAHTMSNVDKG